MDNHAERRHGFAARAAGLASALGLAILVVAAPVHAQQGDQGQQMQQMQKMQQMQQELQQVQKQLRGIRQKALQDSSIREQRLALQETVRGAMTEIDPDLASKEDTLNALQRRLRQAQQSQDTAQLRSLMTRGRQVQQQVQAVRDTVLQRDSIANQLEQFRQDLNDKMVEIDPNAAELIERRDSIVRQFRQMRQQMMGARQGGNPPGDSGQR